MPPWLFNLFMDEVLDRGMSRQFVWGEGAWVVSEMVADLSKKLQKLVSEFVRVCEGRKMGLNVNKCKIIMFCKEKGQDSWGAILNL